MHGTFFYIGLGLGLAAACGVRPFLPVLLAGALGSAGALGVTFAHGHFTFLQSTWWLLAAAVGLVLAYALQLGLGLAPTVVPEAGRGDGRRGTAPLGAALSGIAYGTGALLFAGTLAAHGDTWWPGLLGGLAAAALAQRAVAPVVAGARARLSDRQAREAVTVYLDAVSLLLAALVAVLHPLGYVVVALLTWLLLRTRARAGAKYAGLRVLRR